MLRRYLRLLVIALHKLPKCEQLLFRGVKLDVTGPYQKGKKVTWWSVSSSTAVRARIEYVAASALLFVDKWIMFLDFRASAYVCDIVLFIICSCFRVAVDRGDGDRAVLRFHGPAHCVSDSGQIRGQHSALFGRASGKRARASAGTVGLRRCVAHMCGC